MPYKEFESKDTLEQALSKLWGDNPDFVPTTRLEEIICKIAAAQPTGIHAVPDIEEADVGKVLTAGEDGAAWAEGGGGAFVISYDDGNLDKTWKEIWDAIDGGNIAVYITKGEDHIYCDLVSAVEVSNGTYTVTINHVDYTTDSEDGYPASGTPK